MQLKHILLIILIQIIFGSVYPLGKLGTINIPPILFSALRVLIIFIVILPFFKFKIPTRELIFPLLFFSITMGIGVYVTLYYALDISSLVAPIIIGTQLTVPFGLVLSFIFLKEKISIKKWILILFSFLGVIIVAYDPRIGDEWIANTNGIPIYLFYRDYNNDDVIKYKSPNMSTKFIDETDIITLGLNTMGEDGWEMIFTERITGGQYFYFKRKIVLPK